MLKPIKTEWITLLLLTLAAGCGGSSSHSGDGGSDQGAATGVQVRVNELYPNGTDSQDPDWAELKNLSASDIDLSGYGVRDQDPNDLAKLPAGTTIQAGGYLVINCDKGDDAGTAAGLTVPFQLSKKSDEFHLVAPDGSDVDSATWTKDDDVSSDKSWGRLPDGSGDFTRLTPTKGAANL